jgi:hypothetical protein
MFGFRMDLQGFLKGENFGYFFFILAPRRV